MAVGARTADGVLCVVRGAVTGELELVFACIAGVKRVCFLRGELSGAVGGYMTASPSGQLLVVPTASGLRAFKVPARRVAEVKAQTGEFAAAARVSVEADGVLLSTLAPRARGVAGEAVYFVSSTQRLSPCRELPAADCELALLAR